MSHDASPRPMVAPSPRAACRFGVAQCDVTPPAGIYFRNWGAATRDTPAGVHRPFYAAALTVREGDEDPLVLISLDGGWWQASADEWYVRGAVVEALGIDPARVMINLSHTHAGPSLVLENEQRPGGEFIRPYLESLRTKLVATVREALYKETQGELRWAVGHSDLATNRSLRDPAGDRFVTGFNPKGSADDTVLVGRVTTDDGTVIGTLLNYACHPTTLAWDNVLLSPDYIGAARTVMEDATGGAPCLFLLGACGELAPAHQYVGDVDVADGHGRRLGHAAVAALESMLPTGQDLAFDGIVESGAPLGVWLPRDTAAPAKDVAAIQLELPLPIKPDYPPLADILAELAEAKEGFAIERLHRKARLRRSLGDGDTYAFSTWAWKVGDVIFLGWPGEAFSSIQQDLRAAYPDLAIVVMNVVNGTIGYLPPAQLYDEDMYEVWQTPLERGCLEALDGACRDAIDQLVANA